MRYSRTLGIPGLIILALALTPARMAQNVAQTEKTPKPIAGAGCVEAGVEAECLVLKDSKSGTLYNLFVKGKKPDPGMAIQFSGTAHDGPTTCMQGKAVDVKEWKQIKMRCSTPNAARNLQPSPVAR